MGDDSIKGHIRQVTLLAAVALVVLSLTLPTSSAFLPWGCAAIAIDLSALLAVWGKR